MPKVIKSNIMYKYILIMVVVVNVNNLKNGRKPVKLQKESPAGSAAGKVNKVKEIRRRGKDGLKIN